MKPFHPIVPWLLVALVGALLPGCADSPRTTSAGRANAAPPPQKPAATVIVPEEQNALAKRLRRSLVERGWTLVRYTATMARGNQDYEAMARVARYRLTLSGTRVGDCRDTSADNEPSYLYSIAVIENASGDVPLAISGASCLTPIVQRFDDDLDEKRLLPPISPNPRSARDS